MWDPSTHPITHGKPPRSKNPCLMTSFSCCVRGNFTKSSSFRAIAKVTRRTILLTVALSAPATVSPTTCKKLPVAKTWSELDLLPKWESFGWLLDWSPLQPDGRYSVLPLCRNDTVLAIRCQNNTARSFHQVFHVYKFYICSSVYSRKVIKTKTRNSV